MGRILSQHEIHPAILVTRLILFKFLLVIKLISKLIERAGAIRLYTSGDAGAAIVGVDLSEPLDFLLGITISTSSFAGSIFESDLRGLLSAFNFFLSCCIAAGMLVGVTPSSSSSQLSSTSKVGNAALGGALTFGTDLPVT